MNLTIIHTPPTSSAMAAILRRWMATKSDMNHESMVAITMAREQ